MPRCSFPGGVTDNVARVVPAVSLTAQSFVGVKDLASHVKRGLRVFNSGRGTD